MLDESTTAILDTEADIAPISFTTVTTSPEPTEIEQPITTVDITSVSSLLVGVPLTVRGTSFTDTGTVTKVEVQMGTTGLFQLATPGPGNDWSSWSFTTTPTVAGTVRITAKATATWTIGGIARSNTGTDFVDVQMAPDTTGPTLNITEPTDTALPGDETGKAVTIKGTALDSHSGMQRVEFSLDGDPFQPATSTGANWSTWSAPVHIPALNEHTVTIRAWDNSGNQTAKSIKLTVLLPFRAEDVQNNTTPLGYLKNLIEFAKMRLTITDAGITRNIQSDDLRREFLQPFDVIRTDDSVHQVRMSVEVLRKYLSSAADTIFIDEKIPAGAVTAVDADAWNWVSANPSPYLSNVAHQSNNVAGMHQHYFMGTNPGIVINPGDKLFCYVYIDPANAPSELMLQWNDGTWEHRAFWGTDQIAFGTAGTASRRSMGPMPEAGKWVRLEVPASVVGLEGRTINGIAYTLFNGRVTWGRAGKTAEQRKLIAQWKFDEAAGSTTLADATGNGSTGTIVGAVTSVPGRNGNALRFDGVSSAVSLANQPAVTSVTNNFTVAFWAKPEGTHSIPVESTTGTGGMGNQRYAIGPQQAGEVFANPAHSGAGVSVATNGVTVVDHTDFNIPPLLVYQASITDWTHVAVVFENRQPRLYLNGRLVRTGLTSPRSFVHIFPKDIGGMVYGFYKGLLDDVRIYNKPLTAWEIDALCQSKATSSPMADLSVAESTYAQSAYQALLSQLGTSYEELRLARTADTTARTSLAQRLGIDVSKLDSLFLEMSQVSEDKLEKLFGLVDTTRSPLAPADVPSLLIWQRDYLRSLWKQQDHPTGPDAALLPPIVDPDVIGEEFLIKSTQNNSAYSLWQQRKTLIGLMMAQLADSKIVGETVKDRFDRLVTAKIAPIADLLTFDARRKLGKDILPDLEQKQLTLPAFSYLMRTRNLALTSSLLDSEWNDIYSILTQVWKVRSYTIWKTAEVDLSLGPDSFTIPADGTRSPLPTWRATEDARGKWINKLQARIDQDQALKQALQKAVDATEEATLPSLRDALITAINATISLKDYRTDVEIANALTEWLLIDVSGSGFQQTTRISQAIETLQGVLFSLRTENFKTIDAFIDPRLSSSRSKWKLAVTASDFDAEWLWMNSYANWRAATLIFLYPENALLPTLRDNATTAFKELATRLRNTPALTAQQARIEADKYLTKLRTDLVGQLPAELLSPFKITEDKDRAALRALIINLFNPFVDQLPTPHLRQQPPAYLEEVFFFVPLQIAFRLQQARQFTAALDWFRLVYDFNLPVNDRKIYYGLVLEHAITTSYQRTPQWMRDWLNPHTIVRNFRADAYTKFSLMSLVRCLLEYGDSEFTADSNESVPRARMLYMNALDLLTAPEFAPPPASTAIAPNVLPQNLRLHAELNLLKLRSGRNIAGMRRQLEPYGGGQNQISTSITTQLQPTPYRFSALIDRAKQLVSIAQQIEAAYLAALEKLDVENYGLTKARQDLSLSSANVQLQGLRVTEAFEGIGLAQAQTTRSQIQLDHYTNLIDEGTSGWETAALTFQWSAAALSGIGALYQYAAAGAGTLSLNTLFSSGSNALSGVGSAFSALASAASSSAAAASTIASYERRKQEWELQKSLAIADVAIGNQQLTMATQRHTIALKEETISSMQMDNAEATVNFLATKFTNADLYEFMSGVLQGVFSYFLQQATATARLAQNQLSFERQEAPVSFIQADYWEAPSDTSSSGDSQETDRRGLTGSARLLRDIYQLDQYAFDTNKRKLQLTKMISLAQLAPVEFQHFRETGVLRFGTPMEMFDRDFPGHYLRLVKRVRTSVIALIPPIQGIRATLATTGVSRVTIGGDSFQSAVVRRDPEFVALTSPNNATGLFELEQQSDMLLPFEAMGVDTSWEFQMPKAANPFDYASIADVLITIDYTALSDVDYRQQVIRSLNRDLSAERAFSLRRRMDEWYDLNNPDPASTQIVTNLTIKREDFAPHIDNLSLKHVTLFVARADGESFEIPDVSLGFTPEGNSKIVLTPNMPTEQGIISTRRNALSWEQLISGKSPLGVWELALPNSEEVRSRFQDEKIEDILLVVTYSYRTASWPA